MPSSRRLWRGPVSAARSRSPVGTSPPSRSILWFGPSGSSRTSMHPSGPVKRGVGVLTKVLDAMAVGTPIVMSDFAARGIPEIRHGVHAFVATTDEEFLRYVTQALGDPGTCLAMARRARELVERKFDWETHADRLEAIIDPSTREIPAEAAHES